MTRTQCIAEQMEFQGLGSRRVIATSNGGAITSDAGGLLLRDTEGRVKLIAGFAACFEDGRDARRVEHELGALLRQRVYALALGYEDVNDHERLRFDPMLQILSGKLEATRRKGGPALAGKSTLNRLERLAGDGDERYHKIAYRGEAIDRLLVDDFLRSQRRAPGRIVLDIDATDDPVHGCQEGRFFHGYHGHYCYLPLYIFCGDFLLCARLRPSNIDASSGVVEELERIVAQIRARWPQVSILLRADSDFSREWIMAWCEAQGVDYVFGLAKTSRLQEAVKDELAEAKARHQSTGKGARLFRSFPHRTLTSWSRVRRVVAKAEHLAKGANPRFIVTSLDEEAIDAKPLYERIYCARGTMENRLKEQQLDLYADRTSCTRMRSNQLRLYLSAVAYELMHALRRLGLRGTAFAKATCGTVRTRLLKIGAQVRVSVRRVHVALATGYPYMNVFFHAWRNLRAGPEGEPAV